MLESTENVGVSNFELLTWKSICENQFIKRNKEWLPILTTKNSIFEVWRTSAHCFVSSNLFHGQITQKAVHQISDPDTKM